MMRARRLLIIAAFASLVAGATLALTAAPAAAESCPNEQLRAEDSSGALPDCRAYEMVSPVAKNGGAIQGFGASSGGGVLQAGADGGAITYSSTASFAAPQGAPVASQYLSRPGGEGWSTQNISVPVLAGSYGDEPDGVPYQLFSTDLGRGLLLNGERCRGPLSGCPVENPPLPGSGAPPGYQDYYLRNDVTGAFQALLSAAGLGEHPLAPEQFELRFAGATPDLRHIILSTCAALTPDATEVPNGEGGCEPSAPNLYEWSGGALTLINQLPGEAHGTPGAKLAAQSLAISADGQRVYFIDGEDSPIYLSEAGTGTRELPETAGGGAAFQTASGDGSLAFFTRGGDLYRYDALSEATSPPLATEVQGVLGASEDGSYLYYLTANGLFLFHGGGATKVAAAADVGDYPPATGTARVSPDGTHLAFLSQASLTGYENAGDSEVYLYDAGSATLLCPSCSILHHPPLGPSSIPGVSRNGRGATATAAYKPRDLSADGTRLFFDSRDALVPTDTNSHQDVYEWEAHGAGPCKKALGCISLISGGKTAEDSEFIDASANGSDAFFLTGASLLPQDPGSYDLYDAREGGGYPQPPAQIPCEADACQGLPVEAEDPAIGTATPGPVANPPVHFPKARCERGFVRKHGKCIAGPGHKKRRSHRGGGR
jgi:hypothetical protein